MYLGHGSMNIYLNLKPNNYDGESDLLTLDLPANHLDDIMRYVRPIAEEKQQAETKILKDLIKECVFIISQRTNERKNRKTKKR